jgi:hypothetical protein
MRNDLEIAKRGELDTSLIYQLASLGSDGATSSNISRDIWKVIQTNPSLRSETINVPLESKVEKPFNFDMRMILPHEMFAVIYHCYRDYFFKYIVPSMATLKIFWSQVRG